MKKRKALEDVKDRNGEEEEGVDGVVEIPDKGDDDEDDDDEDDVIRIPPKDDDDDPGHSDQPTPTDTYDPQDPYDYPYDYPHEHRRIETHREHKKWKRTSKKLSGHVVGIGTSAGSLKAVKEILQGLPKDVSTAYVVVQHAEPKHKTIRAKDLSGLTDMSVLGAEDGMTVEGNKIYVVPPGVYMSIADNVLKIAPKEEVADPDMPINQFLTSLAEDQKTRAVGIILSGDTTDGANGLKEIRDKGGLAIIQDKDTAEYSKMPESAIASGVKSLVLSPEGIARELKKLRAPLIQKKTQTDETYHH
ncbi:chemotaxis protein CheB [Omnitrophica bacterium]|nr:chemotaxis protein CheB [Candidatus Omnitrophota bacterium]